MSWTQTNLWSEDLADLSRRYLLLVRQVTRSDPNLASHMFGVSNMALLYTLSRLTIDQIDEVSGGGLVFGIASEEKVLGAIDAITVEPTTSNDLLAHDWSYDAHLLQIMFWTLAGTFARKDVGVACSLFNLPSIRLAKSISRCSTSDRDFLARKNIALRLRTSVASDVLLRMVDMGLSDERVSAARVASFTAPLRKEAHQ